MFLGIRHANRGQPYQQTMSRTIEQLKSVLIALHTLLATSPKIRKCFNEACKAKGINFEVIISTINQSAGDPLFLSRIAAAPNHSNKILEFRDLQESRGPAMEFVSILRNTYGHFSQKLSAWKEAHASGDRRLMPYGTLHYLNSWNGFAEKLCQLSGNPNRYEVMMEAIEDFAMMDNPITRMG